MDEAILNNVNLKNPSIRKSLITLYDTDDLVEFRDSDTFFSDLFGEQINFDTEKEMCSILEMADIISIDLPENQLEFSELLLNRSQDDMDSIFHHHIADPIHEPFNSVDIDDDLHQAMQNGVKNIEGFEHDNDMDYANDEVNEIYTNVFDLPNISNSGTLNEPLLKEPGSGNNSISLIHNDLPSLIQEETEDTDMHADLVKDRFVLHLAYKPRIVRRMMLDNVQNTVIPWECYTTEMITCKKRKKQDKSMILHRDLRFPSIAFNPFQTSNTNLIGEELAFSIIEDNRNRFFFPSISEHELNTEFARKNIEKSRRADHRQSFYSSSGSGIHLRSSSDLTITPDMQGLDLGDIDLQDTRNIQEMASFNMVDDGDYGTFDDIYQGSSSNEEQCRYVLQEMRLFLPTGSNKVLLDNLFQLKNRSEISQLFYYTLELASKKMIQPSQIEPYSPIEIELV